MLSVVRSNTGRSRQADWESSWFPNINDESWFINDAPLIQMNKSSSFSFNLNEKIQKL